MKWSSCARSAPPACLSLSPPSRLPRREADPAHAVADVHRGSEGLRELRQPAQNFLALGAGGEHRTAALRAGLAVAENDGIEPHFLRSEEHTSELQSHV